MNAKKILLTGILFWLTGVVIISFANYDNILPTFYQMKFFSAGPIMLIVVLFFIVPVVEESIFRSWTIFLNKKKSKKHNFTVWAVFSSILFASVHIDFYNLNIISLGVFMETFGLGLVFAYLAYHYKFIYAILAHSLYNISVFLISVILPLFSSSEVYRDCTVRKIPFWNNTGLYVVEGNKVCFEGFPGEILSFIDKKEAGELNEYWLPNWYKVRIECENLQDSNEVLIRARKTLVSFLHIKTDTINLTAYEIEKIPHISSGKTFLMKGRDFVEMISKKTNSVFTISSKEKAKAFKIPVEFISVRKTTDALTLMDKYKIKYKEKHVKGVRYFTNY